MRLSMNNTLGTPSKNKKPLSHQSVKLPNRFYMMLAARFALYLGLSAQYILMGWQMYEWTSSPLAIGYLGLCEALPALSLMLFSGTWIDRGNPKIFFLSVVVGNLLSLGIAQQATVPEHLYMASIVTGLMRSFSSSSIHVLTARMLNAHQMQAGAALSSTVMKGAFVIGPVLAGFTLKHIGFQNTLQIFMGAIFIAFLLILAIPYQDSLYVKNPKKNIFKEMGEGIAYVRKEKVLLVCMALDMFAVLFGGVTAMFPVFAKEILHVGPEGVGLLSGSFAIGTVAVGLLVARFPIKRRPGRKLILSVIGFGLCILCFGISRDLKLSMLALLVAGGLDAISMVVRGTLVQLLSPEAMRGRIASINQFFIGSSNELGEFESGIAAHYLGIIPSVIFGGTMTLITVLAVLKLYPGILNIEYPEAKKD